MLDYLVSSNTRRELLLALWRDGARGTASSLARRKRLPFAASYAELQAMSRAGLARESIESGRRVYEADRGSPYAAALKQLVSTTARKVTATKRELDPRWDAVRAELAAQGAPLWSPLRDTAGNTPVEELFANACELSHHDPSVAKLLPYQFLLKKDQLDFQLLEHALTENKQKHTGGFFLALAGALSGDKTLSAWAERLRDRRRTKLVDFFAGASSDRLQALAERNTPALARAWSFRLNMSMDDFRSVVEKFSP